MKLRVKIDDQTFEVEVGDLSARPVLATVDGVTFEVWPEEAQTTAPIQSFKPVPVTQVVSSPRPVVANNVNRSKNVIAPIPGTIFSIAVKEGDAVIPGQELCSLEAMKMKSAIRSTRTGSIAKIFVKAGDRVSQGQALVEYAE
jgi:biotin carboxyl carrier protein